VTSNKISNMPPSSREPTSQTPRSQPRAARGSTCGRGLSRQARWSKGRPAVRERRSMASMSNRCPAPPRRQIRPGDARSTRASPRTAGVPLQSQRWQARLTKLLTRPSARPAPLRQGRQLRSAWCQGHPGATRTSGHPTQVTTCNLIECRSHLRHGYARTPAL
jgi:hypothetical protein